MNKLIYGLHETMRERAIEDILNDVRQHNLQTSREIGAILLERKLKAVIALREDFNELVGQSNVTLVQQSLQYNRWSRMKSVLCRFPGMAKETATLILIALCPDWEFDTLITDLERDILFPPTRP